VPAILALGLLIAFGTVLAHSEPRLTGTNSVPLRSPVVGLREGEQLCQPAQNMPKDSARLRIHLAPQGTRPPKTLVTVTEAQDGVVARAPGRYDDQGLIDVPIDPPVRHSRTDAVVCVRNTGAETIALSGILTPFGNAVLNGKRLDIALTMLWYAKGEPSWIGQLGAIAPRVGHARIGGIWAFWVSALLALVALALALVTTIREARAEPAP
jgi:hypothetical protein